MRNLVLAPIAFGCLALTSGVGAAEVVIDPAVTVNLSGWTYGTGHAVDVGAPPYNGSGGGFKGVLSNAGAYNDASFETYCVELGQNFGFGNTYTDYKIVQGFTYSQWAGNPGTATEIGKLMTYVDTLGALTSVQSTGVQLAIWELVYENTHPFSLTDGSFKNTPTTSNVFANGLLSAYGSTSSLYTVDVLKNDNRQDFLILTAVPEPEAYGMALAGLGIVAVGGLRRRRADR